jgi:hypothetical protein
VQEYSDDNLIFDDIAMPEVEVTVYFGQNLEEAIGKTDARIKIKRVMRYVFSLQFQYFSSTEPNPDRCPRAPTNVLARYPCVDCNELCTYPSLIF